MKPRLLIGLLSVGVALAAAGAYLVLTKAPADLLENRLGPLSDAHAHLFEDDPQFIDKLIVAMDVEGVQKTVLFGSADQDYMDNSKYVGGIWGYTDQMVLEAYNKYPNRIFPMLSGFNPQNENSVSYLREQFNTGKWKGIGEIYLIHESLPNYKTRADHPVMLQIYRVLAEFNAPIFFHHERWLQEDVDALYQVIGQNPDVKFVWLHFAHDGAYVDEIENAFNTYPNLYVVLEVGIWEFHPLELALFENYPNRFMLGTDIGCAENLVIPPDNIPYGEAISAHRRLLSQLSRTTAERMGYKNLEELMG